MISRRQYSGEPGFSEDFHRVRKFLVRINCTNPIQYDFEWGRWEWAFCLPFLNADRLSRIGVWEDDGTIVGLATFEDKPGTVYLCLEAAYATLKADLLDYAVEQLRGVDGRVKVLVNNQDETLQRLAQSAGLVPTQETEGNAVYDIDADRINYRLPRGYAIASAADGVDLARLNRVLWRGFDHPGEAPATDADLAARQRSISAPHQLPELCLYVVAPDGEYAAYCGLWYDRRTQYALVEPLATDPAHRRLGLARAAVLEGIRRCARLGARQAYVGSSLQFYYQIGFRPLPAGTFWRPRE